MLRKTIFTACFAIVLINQANGQWYVKKYNVTDINYLSREQLDESLKASRTNLLYSGIVSVAGVGIFLAGRYLPYEIDDEASFFEQLLGEKGMKKVMMATGAGVVAGGAIAGIVYLTRIGKINSVLNEYYSFNGTLNICPVIIVNSYNQSFGPGFSFTYNF